MSIRNKTKSYTYTIHIPSCFSHFSIIIICEDKNTHIWEEWSNLFTRKMFSASLIFSKLKMIEEMPIAVTLLAEKYSIICFMIYFVAVQFRLYVVIYTLLNLHLFLIRNKLFKINKTIVLKRKKKLKQSKPKRMNKNPNGSMNLIKFETKNETNSNVQSNKMSRNVFFLNRDLYAFPTLWNWTNQHWLFDKKKMAYWMLNNNIIVYNNSRDSWTMNMNRNLFENKQFFEINEMLKRKKKKKKIIVSIVIICFLFFCLIWNLNVRNSFHFAHSFFIKLRKFSFYYTIIVHTILRICR